MTFSFDLAVILQHGRRTMKRRSKKERRRTRRPPRDIRKCHEPMPEIPFDLVIEILTRLPAKSLMRFKSVSNLWSSLVCSRYFSNRLLKSSTPRLFMYLSFYDNSHLKGVLLSLSPSPDSDITSTTSSFVIDQELALSAMESYHVSNVFRGLMCFVNRQRVQIYNTTTRQLVVLPQIEESNIIAEDHDLTSFKYSLVHDPVYNQYKVVCIVARPRDGVERFTTYLSEHWVFLLGGEGPSRWKKISCNAPPHLPLREGLTINGRMYYLAWVVHCVLVIFDTNSEETSMLQVPKNMFCIDTGLIEYGGKIALLHYTNLQSEGEMELWVLEDAEKNIWRSKILVVHPSQLDMVKSISTLRVQGTTRNGEVILVPINTNLFNIFLYDLQKNHIRKIEIEGRPNRHLTAFCEVVGLDDVENLMYI
ncbi:hypothetical protein CARUB_v10007194mg [Capsella rubella]|uniref:F-box domain-containing protein n=1 Tax=Capsella rubella TaxID=81985 RepID=R0H1V1_9BRAS|nr:F-box protein At4g19940 [Capsella rubella]EOA18620.1 hypothetical protein CARUB_v10007194mg [Capsella rubella]